MVTLSDKKKGVENDSTGTVLYYLPVVKSAQDYYPFWMVMPGRRYTAGTQYRYGFNGKEEDDEVKGDGNQQDYGMRIYNTRLGRFLSEDPITDEYPWLTPYQFAANSPIWAVDVDGLEPDKKTDPANSNTNSQNSSLGYLFPDKPAAQIKIEDDLGYQRDKPFALMARTAKTQLGYVKEYKELSKINDQMFKDGKIDFEGWKRNATDYLKKQETAEKAAAWAISNIYKWSQGDQKGISTYNSLITLRNQIYAQIGLGVIGMGIEAPYAVSTGLSLTGPSVFYSGGPLARQEALKFATQSGYRIIDNTMIGKGLTWLTNRTSYRLTEPLWNSSSYLFALGTKNNAKIFINLSKMNSRSIFLRTELPVLQKKGLSLSYRYIQ